MTARKNAPAIEAPAIDAPAIDAPAIDAPAIISGFLAGRVVPLPSDPTIFADKKDLPVYSLRARIVPGKGSRKFPRVGSGTARYLAGIVYNVAGTELATGANPGNFNAKFLPYASDTGVSVGVNSDGLLYLSEDEETIKIYRAYYLKEYEALAEFIRRTRISLGYKPTY